MTLMLITPVYKVWSKSILMCFFFSSRRRHTRFDCDWSSDVCSSDLANRIGVFGMMATIHEMIEMGFTPTEVDQMTGKAIGHAGSATFRTSDLVGLDVT